MFLQVYAPRAPGAKLNSGTTFAWRTCRSRGNLQTNRQRRNCTRSGAFSQAITTRKNVRKLPVSFDLRVTLSDLCGPDCFAWERLLDEWKKGISWWKEKNFEATICDFKSLLESAS